LLGARAFIIDYIVSELELIIGQIGWYRVDRDIVALEAKTLKLPKDNLMAIFPTDITVQVAFILSGEGSVIRLPTLRMILNHYLASEMREIIRKCAQSAVKIHNPPSQEDQVMKTLQDWVDSGQLSRVVK
jgi:hypothetical protein